MNCSVGHSNSPGMRFCTTCGTALPDGDGSSAPTLTITLADLDPEPTPSADSGQAILGHRGGEALAGRLRVGEGRAGDDRSIGELEVRIDADGQPQLPEAEAVRARYRVGCVGWASPTGPAAGVRLQAVVDGAGNMAVSDRRLVCVLTTGAAQGHPVPRPDGALVVWDLPLDHVAEIALERNGPVEGDLSVWAAPPSPTMLRLHVRDVEGDRREGQPADGYAPMRELVAAACDARMAVVRSVEQVRLQDVRAGAWRTRDGSVAAEIITSEAAAVGAEGDCDGGPH